MLPADEAGCLSYGEKLIEKVFLPFPSESFSFLL